MIQCSNLTLEAVAIGSLPYTNADMAMSVVNEYFSKIPFWPQLTKISKKEDMIFQFTENMPSFCFEKECFIYNNEVIKNFFIDFENITNGNDVELLDRYGISEAYSNTFGAFVKFVENKTPDFAKGQVTGAFTLALNLRDDNGISAFYNNKLKEVIIKTVALKALWQIKKIKTASKNTIPIIFIDEPNLSFIGTDKYKNINVQEITDIIKYISDTVKNAGGISGLHCCGKCNWDIPINAGVDIINPNIYNEGIYLPIKRLNAFLSKGGKIAWSIVPTLNKGLLNRVEKNELIDNFNKAVNYLTKNGIDERIIMDNSLITSSCGTGELTEELALKAMRLVKEISDDRKALWHLN